MRKIIVLMTVLLLAAIGETVMAQEPEPTPAVRVRIVTQNCKAVWAATLKAEFAELVYDAELETWPELPGVIYPLATCDLSSKQFFILYEHPESGRQFLFLMGPGGSHDIVNVSELIPDSNPKRRR